MFALSLAFVALAAPALPVAPQAGIAVATPPKASAHWLFDRRSRCYVLDTGFALADGVAWAGACSDGAATGPGAALFTFHGGFVAFLSGSFVRGAVDGPVRISFPNGGAFDGQARFGTLIGRGTISFASIDQSRPNSELLATRDRQNLRVADPATGGDPAEDRGKAKASLTAPEKTEARFSPSELAVPPILVRESEVHPIDVPASPAAALASETRGLAPRHAASDCLAVEGDGGSVGFRNRCDYGVRFSYCVAHSARADVDSCDRSTEAGEVRAQSFAALFDAFGQPDYDVRWIACDADAANPVPRLVRADPPAGQCLPRTMAAQP